MVFIRDIQITIKWAQTENMIWTKMESLIFCILFWKIKRGGMR